MSATEYGSLELKPGGPLAESLTAQLAGESRQSLLALTSAVGANAGTPPLLTPGMLSWYQTWIAPARGAALNQVRGAPSRPRSSRTAIADS